MEILFEEKDIEILDKMLKCLVNTNGIVGRPKFIYSKILSKETPIVDYESYVRIISFYCAEVKKEGYGADRYSLISNEKTANFYKIGGFRSFYDKYIKEEKYRKIKDDLKLKYKNSAIKQSNLLYKTRWWPLGISLAALAASIYSIFK